MSTADENILKVKILPKLLILNFQLHMLGESLMLQRKENYHKIWTKAVT